MMLLFQMIINDSELDEDSDKVTKILKQKTKNKEQIIDLID
jgi:hypothetical protein